MALKVLVNVMHGVKGFDQGLCMALKVLIKVMHGVKGFGQGHAWR